MTDETKQDWESALDSHREEQQQLDTQQEEPQKGSFVEEGPEMNEEAIIEASVKSDITFKKALLILLSRIAKSLDEMTKDNKRVNELMEKKYENDCRIPSSGENMTFLEKVKASFPADLSSMLIFLDLPDKIEIHAKQYMGSDNFGKVLSIVRGLDGEYISAGKNSHFIIKK